MKKINIIFSVLLLAVLASCSGKADYVTYPYVNFDASSYSVSESVGSITLAVSAHAQNNEAKNFDVYFEASEDTAYAGTDFTLTPASAYKSINEEDTHYISINKVNHENEYTGNKKFSVKLVDIDGSYTIGGMHTVSVTIKDDDHPLSDIIGDYTCVAESYYADSWTLSIEPDEEDTSILWIRNLCSVMSDDDMLVYCTVSSDLQQIYVPAPQFIEYTYSTYYLGIVLFDGYYYYIDNGNLTFTYDSALNAWTSDYGFYFAYFTEQTASAIYSLAEYVYPTMVLYKQ